MDVALLVVLILTATVVVYYDTYSVQRTYADVCARRHGHIPPLVDWFFKSDPDPEVERWRRRHRNTTLLGIALWVAALIVIFVRAPTWV